MRSLVTKLARDRRAVVGAAILCLFAVVALIGPWCVADAGAGVDVPLQAPSWHHWLGTTGQGQDVLAQTVVGARATLAVGFAVGLLVTFIGVVLGIGAGWAGGLVDDAASMITNVFLVIPGLPLAIVLAAYLPPGPVRIVVVLTLAGWAWCARVFRAETLTMRRKDFVAAAALAGEPAWRIILIEILPNMASLVAASFIGTTIYAIGAAVGLEFLGLGDLGAVTWGTNLYWASNDSALLTGAWWTFAPTGSCVALVGFALTLVSFALDDVTNPRLAKRQKAISVGPTQASDTPGTPDATGALVSVRDLTIRYAGATTPVVDNVSLEIAPGEVFGLAGESGSGKSTIGHALLRLLPPDAEVRGRVRIGGTDVLSLGAEPLRQWRWREASIVLQSAMSALNPVLTLGEQFADTLAAHGKSSRAAARARAGELLEMVSLDKKLCDSYPHQLSGGMRQRVGLALALALEPRLVILDEPTTALDVVVQRQLVEQLLALQQKRGFAVLFISHDLPLMMSLATRIGVLKDGKLVEVAAGEKLAHPYTLSLLSSFPSLPPLEVRL